MAHIFGNYKGSTFKDFLVLPGLTDDECSPDKVDISVDLAGVHIEKPFLPAAMRSVVGKDMALAASKAGTMPVAPRGLDIDVEADIIRHVKDNEVSVGEIESEHNPVHISDDAKLHEGIRTVKEYGHKFIPVKNRMSEYVGMFHYDPNRHDRLNPDAPITRVMHKFDPKEGSLYCSQRDDDESIKRYMQEHDLRIVPVLDDINRLVKLVFLQKADIYKVGAAIDTYDGWKDRAKAVVEAGADMVFIDVSDAHFSDMARIIGEYKDMFADGPPICAGNIVTEDAFNMLADAGADVIKVGMGSGSICTTNMVLGVGAPPYWAITHINDARHKYSQRKSLKPLPIIMDGGIEDTYDIGIALTQADAVMAGKLFAGFEESEGALVMMDRKKHKEYWGEGSKRAAETAGNLHRYHLGGDPGLSTFQGVDGLVPYTGRLKPGVEEYAKALRETLSHAGARNLGVYRNDARLIRLTENSKIVARTHGLSHIQMD